jgi:hypothetical protein
MATRTPAPSHCPATRWSLDDLVDALAQRRTWLMSRSSLWRILAEADLKPQRSVYGLNSHAPDFEVKAHDMCAFYLPALRFFEHGRVVVCSVASVCGSTGTLARGVQDVLQALIDARMGEGSRPLLAGLAYS